MNTQILLKIAEISLTEDNRKHLWRHFYTSDQEKIAGSRFDPSFAPDPDSAWSLFASLIKGEHDKNNIIIRNDDKDRIVIDLFFDKKTYPNGIGTNSLIPIKDLDPEVKKTLRRAERGDGSLFPVWRFSGKAALTWEAHVVFRADNADLPELVTFFPGIYAPPFPDELR